MSNPNNDVTVRLAALALTLLLSACASNPARPYCTGPLVPINMPSK